MKKNEIKERHFDTEILNLDQIMVDLADEDNKIKVQRAVSTGKNFQLKTLYFLFYFRF